MNKKELHESDQAIEMTARALGEVETNSAQPSANGDSASQLEVEFEQVRELGRVIRDSSSHDSEQWASPADAAQLKQLINAEFVSDKLVTIDNTGQMRLAALAATILLMFGIGYVLVRTPPAIDSSAMSNAEKAIQPNSSQNVDSEVDSETLARGAELKKRLEELTKNIESQRNRLQSQLNNPMELEGRNDAPGKSSEVAGSESPKLRESVETTTDALSANRSGTNKFSGDASSLGGILDAIEGKSANDSTTAPERKKANGEIQSETIVGDFAANPVSDGSFEQQGLASDPNLGLTLQSIVPGESRSFSLQDGQILIGNGVREIVDLPQSGTELAKGMQEKTGAVPGLSNSGDDSQSKFSYFKGVPGEPPSPTPNIDPNGTTVPLPRFAETKTNTTVVVPDSGKVFLGGLKSQSASPGSMNLAGNAPLADTFLATGDLDIPFSQNSFGAAAPHFGGFGGGGGEYGFRPDVDRDERPSNEQYELPPENQFLKPVLERALSTFSIDVDTASYANIRRFITNGQLPPGNAVRIEEMVNYFSYAYPQPVDGKPFSVSLDVAQCPWQPANKLVRVGIQGRDIPRDNRPASNLVFLIDVSGSMSDQNKLPLLQRSMLMLVDQLTENDRVSIVTYASNAGVRLQPTSGDQKQVIQDVINSLSSGGSTHGSAGITTAYELATQHFIEGGTNRVILATDGDLNVGVTDDDSLVQLIKSKAESGVFLSVLGFGTGNLKDGKLEKIADNGNGQYCYIDSIREAQKVLVAEMSGSLVTIAKDVKLQIEFNPAEVASYRLIGYENRALKNEDFANDRVDAGDIGAGHSVTALYEIVPVRAVNKPAPAPPSGLRYQNSQAVVIEQGPSVDEDALTDAARTGELMNVALRFKQPESNESDLLEVTVKDSNQSFDAAPADFRFAASVAAYGMKLRQSSYAGNWTWSDIENTAVSTISDDPQGHRAELVDLVRQTRRMLGR